MYVEPHEAIADVFAEVHQLHDLHDGEQTVILLEDRRSHADPVTDCDEQRRGTPPIRGLEDPAARHPSHILGPAPFPAARNLITTTTTTQNTSEAVA